MANSKSIEVKMNASSPWASVAIMTVVLVLYPAWVLVILAGAVVLAAICSAFMLAGWVVASPFVVVFKSAGYLKSAAARMRNKKR